VGPTAGLKNLTKAKSLVPARVEWVDLSSRLTLNHMVDLENHMVDHIW